MQYMFINTPVGSTATGEPCPTCDPRCVKTRRIISPEPGSVVTKNGREYLVTRSGQLRRLDRLSANSGR